MALSGRQCAYSKIDKEDPEEVIHRRAQFLIYKALKKGDVHRKPSFLGVRVSKLKVKIGKRLKRLRKRILSGVSAVEVSISKKLLSQLRVWKSLFRRGGVLGPMPPLFK